MRPVFLLFAAALASGVACNNAPASSAQAAPASAQPQPAAAAAPAQAAQPGSAFTGTIAEATDAGEYTYARLKGPDKEVWIAATRFDAKVGTPVTVSLDMPMADFESKTLKRTFPMLYFVSEVALDGQPLRGAPAAPPSMMTSHGGGGGRRGGDVQVTKMAPPAGGLSVADVIAKGASLSGQKVTVNGTVVKFNGGIMERNWLHIQDGSGSADTGTHDLTVTTTDQAQVGDVVTISGVIGTKRDFGAGYAYDVIVEQAAVTRR